MTHAKIAIGVNHLCSFTLTALLYIAILYRGRFRNYFKKSKFDGSRVFLFILLLFAAYPLAGAGAAIIQSLELPEWMNHMDSNSLELLSNLLQMTTMQDVITNVLIIALIPAIGEELLFRAILQNGLENHTKSGIIAIVLSSIIFSAIHLEASGFLTKLVISLVLGYSYYRSRALWVPMLLHFMNNTMQVLSLYAVQDRLKDMDNVDVEFPWIGAIISIIICLFVVSIIENSTHESS